MKIGFRRMSRLEDRLVPIARQEIAIPHTMPAASLRWTTTPVFGSFAPGTSIQQAPFVSRTLPTFRATWTLRRWRSTSNNTALAEVFGVILAGRLIPISAPMAAVLKRAAGRAPSCARTAEYAARGPRLSGSFNRWRLPGAIDN